MKVRLADGVSWSLPVNVMGSDVFWVVVTDCSSAVGASLTGLTVSTKVSLVVLVPSFTLTVIVVVPFAFGAGVIVTVRLAPLPPNTMLAFGTSVVLLEVPLTVSEPGSFLHLPR